MEYMEYFLDFFEMSFFYKNKWIPLPKDLNGIFLAYAYYSYGCSTWNQDRNPADTDWQAAITSVYLRTRMPGAELPAYPQRGISWEIMGYGCYKIDFVLMSLKLLHMDIAVPKKIERFNVSLFLEEFTCVSCWVLL